MKTYHLIPLGDRWELEEEGGASVATYDDKASAVTGSRRTVQRESGSLVIHNADGTIEEERTYPRSLDLAKSPG
jgi:hypothetical protein